MLCYYVLTFSKLNLNASFCLLVCVCAFVVNNLPSLQNVSYKTKCRDYSK